MYDRMMANLPTPARPTFDGAAFGNDLNNYIQDTLANAGVAAPGPAATGPIIGIGMDGFPVYGEAGADGSVGSPGGFGTDSSVGDPGGFGTDGSVGSPGGADGGLGGGGLGGGDGSLGGAGGSDGGLRGAGGGDGNLGGAGGSDGGLRGAGGGAGGGSGSPALGGGDGFPAIGDPGFGGNLGALDDARADAAAAAADRFADTADARADAAAATADAAAVGADRFADTADARADARIDAADRFADIVGGVGPSARNDLKALDGAAVPDAAVRAYLESNPGSTDKQIREAMDTFGVSPAQIARVTGLPQEEVRRRYDAAGPGTGTGVSLADVDLPGTIGGREGFPALGSGNGFPVLGSSPGFPALGSGDGFPAFGDPGFPAVVPAVPVTPAVRPDTTTNTNTNVVTNAPPVAPPPVAPPPVAPPVVAPPVAPPVVAPPPVAPPPVAPPPVAPPPPPVVPPPMVAPIVAPSPTPYSGDIPIALARGPAAFGQGVMQPKPGMGGTPVAPITPPPGVPVSLQSGMNEFEREVLRRTPEDAVRIPTPPRFSEATLPSTPRRPGGGNLDPHTLGSYKQLSNNFGATRDRAGNLVATSAMPSADAIREGQLTARIAGQNAQLSDVLGSTVDRFGNPIAAPQMPRFFREGGEAIGDNTSLAEYLQQQGRDNVIDTDPMGTAQQYLADVTEVNTIKPLPAPTRRSVKRVSRGAGRDESASKEMNLKLPALTSSKQMTLNTSSTPEEDQNKPKGTAREQMEDLVRSYELKIRAAKNRARGLSADVFGAPTLEGPSLTKNTLAKRRFAKGGMVNALKGTKAVDEKGKPVMAYRGEYGPSDKLSTELGSYSFGTKDAANLYATEPNNFSNAAEAMKVFPAQLSIRKPVVNAPGDSYIDLPVLRKALGKKEFDRVVKKNMDRIEDTNAFEELADAKGYTSVMDLMKKNPKDLDNLATLLYPILDDPKSVKVLQRRGYDGAIYGGSGATGGEPEYRVFGASQAISPYGNKPMAPRNARQQMGDFVRGMDLSPTDALEIFGRSAGVAGAALTPSSTNQGEAEELARRRAMPPTVGRAKGSPESGEVAKKRFAKGGFVSVLEKGDMSSPAYRAQLEREQALEGSYPEMVAAPLLKSARAGLDRLLAGRAPEKFSDLDNTRRNAAFKTLTEKERAKYFGTGQLPDNFAERMKNASAIGSSVGKAPFPTTVPSPEKKRANLKRYLGETVRDPAARRLAVELEAQSRREETQK
jgi:hypothetical protein